MLNKRMVREDDSVERTGELAAVETLRSAAQGTAAEKPAEKKEEERVSLFWRVFGGTILSITALVGITLFNNMSSSISELRAELSREREARAELVKKDDFQQRSQNIYERMRTTESLKADIEGIKERTNTNAAAVDAVKKETAGLEVLKERLATTSADLKAAREEVQKLHQEVEKNRLADLERKTARDIQAKQQDDTIKELQKAVQECREKLARLEGSTSSPASPPAPKPKPNAGDH